MSNRYTFRFQSEKCIQCHACQIACQSWNGTAPGLDRRWLAIGFQGSYPKPRLVPAAMSCLHCSDPACLSACPVGAITQAEDGRVLVDAAACIGCGACAGVCPVDAPRFADDGTMHKCDLCAGASPACVSACPTGALALVCVSEEEKEKLDSGMIALYRSIAKK